MPMSKKQLADDTEAYQGFISSGWEIIAVEKTLTSGAEDRAHLNCGLCGKPIDEYEAVKRVTFIGAPSLGLTHVQALLCYNGVACRRRKHEQDTGLARLREAA
jgi:hypothetical protein